MPPKLTPQETEALIEKARLLDELVNQFCVVDHVTSTVGAYWRVYLRTPTVCIPALDGAASGQSPTLETRLAALKMAVFGSKTGQKPSKNDQN